MDEDKIRIRTFLKTLTPKLLLGKWSRIAAAAAETQFRTQTHTEDDDSKVGAERERER